MKILTTNKLLLIIGLLFLASCDSYLDQSPVDTISDESVIYDAASAESTVLGIYDYVQGLQDYLAVTMPGVLSDELTHSGSYSGMEDMDNNEVQSNNSFSTDFWENIYTGIYVTNTVIENLTSLELDDLSDDLKSQYLGEAYFLRAYFHFEALRLWGGIPIATTTNLDELSVISRSTESECIAFVISDLSQAESYLEDLSVDDAPYRANEWAAKGLLARVYLYSGDVSTAGEYADEVISSGLFPLEANYQDMFTGDTDEAIFRCFQSTNDQNDLAFYLNPSGRFEFAVSDELVSAFQANSSDTRAMIEQNTSDSQGRYYVTKYSDVSTGTDEVLIIRAAEMYLIRAEANIGTTQGESDLETVMARAGLDVSGSNPATQASILEQRFLELSFEGHRWYDLKRTGEVDEVMSEINPSTWESTDALLPIPYYEMLNNPNLTQNP